MKTTSGNRFHYCPIGDPQRRFGAYLTGAGRELTRPGEEYPHNYHSSDYYFTWKKGRRLTEWEYQLLYIRSGRGIIEFERGKSITVTDGTLIILHPGEWHRYRPDPDVGWDEAYIGIGGEILERIIAPPFFAAAHIIVKLPPRGWFERELLSLVDEIQKNNAEHPYTLAMKTMTLVSTVIESAHTYKAADSRNTLIRRAIMYIGHHLGEIIDFERLSNNLGMGYSLFRKRFREYTGLAPLEYQNVLKFRRAAHMLASSDMPVGEIAEELGFHTPAYFSRFFHKASGRSPIMFRKENQRDSAS